MYRQVKTYLAIKTDISKAYDCVEWRFLEKAMIHMGFSYTWIGWIMSCVRSVSYSVLVNGSPYGEILPERGIHQGDPISPLLFLFCMEMLSQRLRTEEMKLNIVGLSICNFGPRVNLLLFVDDFFFQSNNRNSKALAQTLWFYMIFQASKLRRRNHLSFLDQKYHKRRNNVSGDISK